MQENCQVAGELTMFLGDSLPHSHVRHQTLVLWSEALVLRA